MRRALLFFLLLLFPSLPAFRLFAAAAEQHGSDHRPERILAEIALYRFWQQRLWLRPQSLAPGVSSLADQGNLAVLETDDTMLISANTFDLDNKSLRFTRNPDGTYRAVAGSAPLDSAAAESGARITLRDDDTTEVRLGFNFPFYDQAYASVFLNSDGNLTFTQGDTLTTERDLSRFLSGAPRVAPFFEDVNPAEGGGRVTVATQAGRVVFSWLAVPLCCEDILSPPIPKQTFQAILFADGSIEFSYAGIQGTSAVVGLSPGRVTFPPALVDLSAQDGTRTLSSAIAEVFTTRTSFSAIGAARKYYSSHEDAYDFLVVWTNFTIPQRAGVLASALLIRNQVTGLGPFFDNLSTFDFASELGSRSGRLQTLIMMNDLNGYPDNPEDKLILRDVDSTLSVMGQEAGHRWLVNFRYPRGNDPRSTVLLGRDLLHWSFFSNSEASVVEGNEIRDNGDGSFTTVDAVRRFGSLDQYAMGLRGPEEVRPTFVVTDPDIRTPRLHIPQIGVSFRGNNLPVTIDKIIEANGPRLPTAAVSPKDFNFAFILVTQRGTAPKPEEIAKLDRIRTAWEMFWSEATGTRSRARTALVRAARILPLPAAATGGVIQATMRLESPGPSSGVRFALQSSNTAVLSAPASVTVPAGATTATFSLTAGARGVSFLTATAEGYEVAAGALSVSPASAMAIKTVSGDQQVGRPGQALANPLIVAVTDTNGLPAVGVALRFTVSSVGGSVTSASATTDATGRAQVSYTLGSQFGAQTITATLVDAGAVSAAFTVTALRNPSVPAAGAVNGASFAAAAAVSPGSIISIFGSDLSGPTLSASGLPLPTTLGSASVRIGDIAAPLFFVSPRQINAQVPFEAQGPSAPLTANNGAAAAPPITLPLTRAAPGLFTVTATGSGAVAALHAADNVLVSATSPAKAGEFVSLFATGLGPVTPQASTGRAAPAFPLSATVDAPQVTIGGAPATVSFSGLAPGFVGLYQVNVQVPSGVSGNALPLVVTVAGASSNPATIAVQ